MKKELLEAAGKIKTPIALLTVVIIFTEIILIYLIEKSTGTDFTILVIAIAALPFSVLFVLSYLYKNIISEISKSDSAQPIKPEVDKKPSGKKYDLFVSAPMASFESEGEFKSSREAIFNVVRGIKKNCKFESVFYAGAEIESFKDFDVEDLSVIEDYDATFHSKYFILFYPKKLVTSDCGVKSG